MKTYFYILLIIILAGCTKENADFHAGALSVPEITGYISRDISGYRIRAIGIPNIKLGSESNNLESSNYFLACYPNPCDSRLNLYIKTPTSNTKKVWITHANYSGETHDTGFDLGANNLYVGGSPIFQTEFTQNQLVINLTEFQEGYYRIYLKIDDHPKQPLINGGFILVSL